MGLKVKICILGEARSGLAPNKPMRTGSLREAAADNMKRVVTSATQPEDSDYESFIVSSASPVSSRPSGTLVIGVTIS